MLPKIVHRSAKWDDHLTTVVLDLYKFIIHSIIRQLETRYNMENISTQLKGNLE